MTKAQLAAAIAKDNDITKAQASRIIDDFAAYTLGALQSGDKVSIAGFGTFSVRRKPATKARKGTNPFTGEPMTIKAKPASRVAKWRPAKAFKDAL